MLISSVIVCDTIEDVIRSCWKRITPQDLNDVGGYYLKVEDRFEFLPP